MTKPNSCGYTPSLNALPLESTPTACEVDLRAVAAAIP
jgi:hypothetical protein